MGILNEAHSNAQEMSKNGTGNDYQIFSDTFVEAQKKSLDTWTRENLGMTLAQKQKLDNQQFVTLDNNGNNPYQEWYNSIAEQNNGYNPYKSWQQALYANTVGNEGWTNPASGTEDHVHTLGDVLDAQNKNVIEALNNAYKNLTENGYTGGINNMSQEQINQLAEVNQKRIANGMKPLDLSNVDTTASNGFYSTKQYEKWMNYPSVDYTPITTSKTEEVAVKTENNAYAGDTYEIVTVDNTSKINEEKNRQISTAYYWRLIASGNKDEDGKTVFDSDQYKLLQHKTNIETGTDYLAWKAEHKKELKDLGEDEIYLKYKTAADGYNALVAETAATYLFYGTGSAKPTLEDYALLNGYTMKYENTYNNGSYAGKTAVYTDANGNKIDEITFKNNYDQYIYDLTDRNWAVMHEGVEHLMPDALQARYDELNEELKDLDQTTRVIDPHSGTILGNWREEDPDAYNKALSRKEEIENTLSALQTAHDYESVFVPTYAKLTCTVDLYGETIENWFYNLILGVPTFLYNTFDSIDFIDYEPTGTILEVASEDLNSYNVHLGDRINTISGMYTSEISQLAVQLGVSAVQMALDGALQFGMGSAGFTGIFKSIDTGSIALNKIANFLLPTGAGGSGSLITMFGRVFNSTYAQFDDMLKDYIDEDGNRLYSPQDIWWYAIKTAAVEYYAEKVFGGPLDIYNTGSGLFEGIGERLFRKAISTNKVAEAVVSIVASAIEEGAEEVIASFTEPAWRSQLFGTTYSEEFDNLGGVTAILEAFASGAALALVTGGPSAVSSVVTQRNVNSAVDAWGRLNSGEIEIGSVEWGNENAKIEKVLANGLGTRQFMNNIDFTATEQMNIVSKNIDNHINAVKQAISEGKSANEIAKMNEEFGKTFPRDYGDIVVRAMNSFMLKLDNEGKIAKDSNGNYSLNNNITKSLKDMQDWTINEFKANIVQSIVRPSSVFVSPSSLALYQATHSQEEVQDLADKALVQIVMQKGEQLQNNVDRNKQKSQSEEARNNPTSIYKEGQYRALNAQIGTDGNIAVNQNGVVLGESQASEALGIETAKEINLVGEQSLEELYTEEVAVVDWMADREYLKEHCKDIAKSVTSAVCDGVQINGKNYVFAGWSASNAKISNNGQRVFRAMFVEESRWSDVAPVLMGVSNYTNEALSGTNGWSFNQNKANINKFFVYAANAWSESKVLTQLNPNNFIMIPDVEGEEYTEYLIGEANNLNTLYARLNERTTRDKITDGSMYMIVDGDVNEMTTQQVRGGVGFKGNLVPVSLDGILILMEKNGVTNLGRDINGNIITKADLIQRVKSEGALYLAPESVVKLGSQYKTEDGKYDMESMYKTLEDKRFALRGKETYDAKHEEVIDKINKLGQLIRGQSVQSDEAKQAIANLASKSVEHIYSYLDQETDIEKIKAMFEILGITEKQNSDNALKNILSELLVKGDLEQLKSPVLRGMIRQACQDLIKNAKGGSLYVENTRCSLDRVCRDTYAVMERMMLDEANTDYNIDGTINKNQRAYGDLGFLKENEMIVPTVEGKEGVAFRFPVATGKNTVSFTRAELDEKLQKLYPKDTIVEAYRSAAQHVLDADYDGDTFAFTMCEDLIKLINATEADLKNVKLINFDHAKKGSVQIDNMDTFRQQVVEAVEAALTGNDLAMYDNWINAIYSCSTLTQVQKQQYAGIMGLGYIMCIDQVKTGIGIGNIEELYKANPEDQTLKSIYSVKQAVDLVVKQVSEAFNKEYGIKLNESASNAVADKTMSRVQTHSGNIFGELTNSVKKFSEGKMNLESTQDMTNISILENIRYNTGRIVASGTKTSTIALFMDVLSRAENSAQVAEMFYETMSKHGVTDKQVAFDYLMAGITDEMSKAQKAVEGKVDKTTIFGREFTSYSQALNFATNIVNNLGYQFTQDMNDAYHSDKNEAEANYIDLKTITNEKLEHLAKYMFMERQKDEAIVPRFKLESYVANMVDLASRVTYSDPKDGVVYTVNKAEADVIDYSAIKDFQSKMSDWLTEGTSISALKSKIRPLLYSVGLQEYEISNVLDNLNFDTATADTLTSEQSNKVVSAMARLSEMVCEAGVFYDFGTHGNQTRTIRDADGKERNVRVQQVEVGSVPVMVQKAMERGVKFNWFNKVVNYTLQQNTVFTQIFGNGSETGLLIDHAIKHTDTNIAHQKGQCSLLARSFNIPSLNEELSKMEFKVNGEKVDGTELSAIDIMIARALYEYKEENRTASLNNLLTGLYSFSNYSTWYSNKDSDCKVIIEANARLVELNNKVNGRGLTVAEEQERAEILSQGATALEHMKANIESMMGEDQRFALAKKFVQLISQRTCPLIEDAAWRNYGEMFKLNWLYYIPEHTRNVDDRTTHGSYDRYTMRASDMSHSFGRNGSGNSGTVVYNVFEMMEEYSSKVFENYYNNMLADQLSKLFNYKIGEKTLTEPKEVKDYIDNLRGWSQEKGAINKAISAAGSFIYGVQLSHSWGAVAKQHASYHIGKATIDNYMYTTWNGDKIEYTEDIKVSLTNPWSKLARQIAKDVGKPLLGGTDQSKLNNLQIDPETGTYGNNIISYFADWESRYGYQFIDSNSIKYINSLGSKGINVSDINTTFRLGVEAMVRCIELCAEVNGMTREAVYEMVQKQDYSLKDKNGNSILKDFNSNIDTLMADVMASQPHNSKAQNTALQRGALGNIFGMYKTQPFTNWDSGVNAFVQLTSLDKNDPNYEYMNKRAWKQAGTAVRGNLGSIIEIGVIEALLTLIRPNKRKKYYDEDGDFRWDMLGEKILSSAEASLANNVPFIGAIASNFINMKYNEEYGLYNGYLVKTNEDGYTIWFKEDGTEAEYGTDYVTTEDALENGLHQEVDLGKWAKGMFGAISSGESYGENIIDGVESLIKNGLDFTDYNQKQGMLILSELLIYLATKAGTGEGLIVPISNMMTDIDSMHQIGDNVYDHLTGFKTNARKEGTKLSDNLGVMLNDLFNIVIEDTTKTVVSDVVAINSNLSDSTLDEFMAYKEEWDNAYRMAHNGSSPSGADNFYQLVVSAYDDLSVHGLMTKQDANKLLMSYYQTNVVDKYDPSAGKKMDDPVTFDDIYNNPIYSDAGKEWGLTYDAAPFFINAFLSGDYANVQDASERFWEVNTDGNTLSTDEAKAAIRNGNITSQAEIDMFGNDELNDLYNSFIPEWTFVRLGADENDNGEASATEVLNYLKAGGSYDVETLQRFLDNETTLSRTGSTYKGIMAYVNKGSNTTSTSTSSNMPKVELPKFDYSLPTF